jgi:hypothetical protein
VHLTRRGRLAGRAALAGGLTAVLLAAAVAVAGESAAVPGLGASTWYPPWDLGRHPSSALVTVVLTIAYLLGGGAVALGLVAFRNGARLSGRAVAVLAGLAVAVLVVLPPLGSADHLSYAAYGRIAAAGDDPYVLDPLAWRGGTDPVASAVQPPWQHTTSVYGPVATAAQALAALGGDGSLRLTVLLWQLVAGGSFLVVALILDRLTRADPAARTRAAVLWTLNPLLLVGLVLGGHLDVLAVALAMGALALAARRPTPAGALLGAAVGSKITFALFALAILWGLRRLPRPVALRTIGLGVLGTLAVLVPAHWWSGPHTYDQLRQASRFVSLATPWRPLVDQLDPVYGGVVRTIVGPASLALGAGLALLLARRFLRHDAGGLPAGPPPPRLTTPDDGSSAGRRESPGAVEAANSGGSAGATDAASVVTRDAVRGALVIALAWVATTPYALPWYDAMVWAPLALLGAAAAPTLDLALLGRLTVLSLAYVPGRVVGMSEQVERITLGFRREVAPWLDLALLIVVIVWACARPRSPRPADRRPSAPERARSPK